MTRLVDLALGVVLGAAAMTVLVAVAADSPNLDPARIFRLSTTQSALRMTASGCWSGG
jgi:hypothetical protein